MSIFVKTTDFGGLDGIATDKFSKSGLQAYVDRFEERYLQDLLGCELFDLFKTDFQITGTEPTDPIYKAIWDAFCIDDSLCGIRRSEGMKAMLVLFIYWEYVRDQPIKNNIAGNLINQQANSTQAPMHQTNIYTNYNHGAESYWSIQWYICENLTTYPKFNGQAKHPISFV